jgi:HEAT repeat protein
MYLADYVKGALRMTTDTEGSILVSALQSNEVGTMEEAVRQLMFEVPAADRADVVPLLIGLLRSSKASAASRSKAAVVLGHYKATDVLIEVLGDPGHRDVQQAVAEALGTAADRRAVDKLVNALLENPDRDVRHAAATALGRIGDPRAVDALIKSLKDKYLEYAAAGALGHLKDARSVEPLIQVLKSANNGARAASATALGSIGDLRALEALEELSRSDPDDFVRKAATEAVRVLRGDRIIIRDERVSRSEGYPDWGDRR